MSYRGPRSMVTVDMLVDSRSISQSIYPPSVGRVAGKCQSTIDRYMVDVLTDHWIDRQLVAIASAVCLQHIGEPSVKYWSMHRLILDRTTRKGMRILPAKYKSASKIYKNNKGKDKQSVIGKAKTQEAC